jgi:hypothetical protein
LHSEYLFFTIFRVEEDIIEDILFYFYDLQEKFTDKENFTLRIRDCEEMGNRLRIIGFTIRFSVILPEFFLARDSPKYTA